MSCLPYHPLVFATQPELALAAKATYLASLIRTEGAVAILQTAAASPEAVVRVAAASSLRNLPEVQAEQVLDQLVDDPDAGIRKVTLNSARQFRSLEIEAKLQQVAETDSEDFVRNAAASTVRVMQRKRQLPGENMGMTVPIDPHYCNIWIWRM